MPVLMVSCGLLLTVFVVVTVLSCLLVTCMFAQNNNRGNNTDFGSRQREMNK